MGELRLVEWQLIGFALVYALSLHVQYLHSTSEHTDHVNGLMLLLAQPRATVPALAPVHLLQNVLARL